MPKVTFEEISAIMQDLKSHEIELNDNVQVLQNSKQDIQQKLTASNLARQEIEKQLQESRVQEEQIQRQKQNDIDYKKTQITAKQKIIQDNNQLIANKQSEIQTLINQKGQQDTIISTKQQEIDTKSSEHSYYGKGYIEKYRIPQNNDMIKMYNDQIEVARTTLNNSLNDLENKKKEYGAMQNDYAVKYNEQLQAKKALADKIPRAEIELKGVQSRQKWILEEVKEQRQSYYDHTYTRVKKYYVNDKEVAEADYRGGHWRWTTTKETSYDVCTKTPKKIGDKFAFQVALEQAASQIAKASQDLDVLKNQEAKINNEISACDQNIKIISDQSSCFAKERNAFEGSLPQQRADCQKQYNDAVQHNNEQKQPYEATKIALDNEVAQLTREIQAATTEKTNATNQSAQLKQSIDSKENEIKSLQQQNTTPQTEVNALLDDIARAEREKTDAHNKSVNLEKSLIKSTDDITKYTAEIQFIDAKLQESQNALQFVQSEITTQTEVLAHLEHEQQLEAKEESLHTQTMGVHNDVNHHDL